MYAPTHQLQVERRESWSQSSDALTHQLQVERREITEPIKCMLSPHTSYRWRGEVMEPIKYALTTTNYRWERRESHRDNQVYALTTHQLQVERRENHRANQVDGDY